MRIGLSSSETFGKPRGLWTDAFRRYRRNKGAMVGLVLLLLIVFAAIMAPWITRYSPFKQRIRDALSPPSASHILGTDHLGRDLFARIIYGARTSLKVGSIATGIACCIGIPLGLVSGYYSGWLDTIMMRLVDILLAFPGMLLALAIMAILGPSLSNAMFAAGVYIIPDYVRVARASTLAVREMDYVVSARAIGCPSWYTIQRHIFPNVLLPLIVLASLNLASTILFVAGLSFLGMGAQPPTAEWGIMLKDGRLYLRQAWWPAVFPGLALLISLLAINMVGEGLRNALDPRGLARGR